LFPFPFPPRAKTPLLFSHFLWSGHKYTVAGRLTSFLSLQEVPLLPSFPSRRVRHRRTQSCAPVVIVTFLCKKFLLVFCPSFSSRERRRLSPIRPSHASVLLSKPISPKTALEIFPRGLSFELSTDFTFADSYRWRVLYHPPPHSSPWLDEQGSLYRMSINEWRKLFSLFAICFILLRTFLSSVSSVDRFSL